MPKKIKGLKSSLLKRILSVPKMAEYALNIYDGNVGSTAGVIEITIPNGNIEPIEIVNATGVYNFGGIGVSDSQVFITKIIIDDIVIFDSSIAGKELNSVFSNDDTLTGAVASNSPPFLINHKLQVFAKNTNKYKGNKPEKNMETIFLSLVPIE